jgi:hypothetical protein
MNNRTTHNVAVNVLENWTVKLPAAAQKAKIAVAANMHPENQMQMLDQCGAVDFIAADTMDLWISIANERLHDVLKRIDLLVINDGEAKEFAGTTNLVEAGRKLLAKGPKFVIVKRGEHGSYLFGEKKEHFFSCSAYPLPPSSIPRALAIASSAVSSAGSLPMAKPNQPLTISNPPSCTAASSPATPVKPSARTSCRP